MTKITIATSLLLSASMLGVVACDAAKPVQTPASNVAATPRLPQKDTETKPSRAVGDAVVISDDLKAKCGMPSSSDAPKFEFDSPVLGGFGRELLDALAKCLMVGSLHGQRIQLIGRADPRGEVEYNMVLGSSRAEAVASYLRSLGVPADQIGVSSRGELDAVGVDEATWALDRRVDVMPRPQS